jgi:ketosteroid isomerase-like protein
MSEDNVKAIRGGFAALDRGDLDALVELYDEDAIFETLLLGTHHGKEAIRRIHAENLANQSGYSVEPVEMIEHRRSAAGTSARRRA